jgi:2,3-bisphosphoglycerate-independent phosphoglycerate mutase
MKDRGKFSKGSKIKFVFLVGDGMADRPLPQLNNRTPLEVAKIENMHALAREGVVGMCRTIPRGMPPGSDVANLSLLGFNPAEFYTGRGPLEAASIGIKLKRDDCAFRCNLVNIQDEKMIDYSAGHISTEEANMLIGILNHELAREGVHFYTGVDYRHICVIKGKFENLRCTPPHDITSREISEYLPAGEGHETVTTLMNRSRGFFSDAQTNVDRINNGKLPASQIWLWGQGYKPELLSFREKFGLEGSVITAVDLIRGIGLLAGLEIIKVEGATGFVDTNYEGKADAALSALEQKDFVFIHVEAPDEAGHQGDAELKIKAIEDLDARLLGRIRHNLADDYRILVMPDHPTPVRIKTHSADPVPFILFGYGIKKNRINNFTERDAEKSDIFVEKGHELIRLLFNGPGQL